MLNRRQDRAYEDWADIYEPLALEPKSGSKRLKDRKVSATPIATNVRCMFVSKPESAQGGDTLGRVDKDIIFTLDKFRFAVDQRRDDGELLKIDDGYVIQLKTPGHPDKDGWWLCQGGAKVRPRRRRRDMNVQSVMAKRSLKAYGID